MPIKSHEWYSRYNPILTWYPFMSIRCSQPGATPKGFTLEVIEQLPVWTTPGLREAPQNWRVWLDVQPNIYDLELQLKYLRYWEIQDVFLYVRVLKHGVFSKDSTVCQTFIEGGTARWFTSSMCFSKIWDDHPPFSHHLTISFLWFWAWESPRKTEKSDDCAWNLELQ